MPVINFRLPGWRVSVLGESVLIGALLVFILTPLLNLCLEAFRYNAFEKTFTPEGLSLRWFEFIFARGELPESFFNSYLIAVCSTFLLLVICLPAAYTLARCNFPFKRLFLFAFLLTNAFPKMGLYISIGVIFYKFNLMGTLTGILIIHMINGLTLMTFISSAAFKNVHLSQEEAARDIGASPLRTFFLVTLPLAAPGIAVATLLTFLESLEESQGTFLVGLPNYFTLPTAMYGVIFDTPMPAAAAFALIYVVPILLLVTVLYLIARRSVLLRRFTLSQE